MAALLEFSMFPIGKGESLSEYVARSLDVIESSGLPYRLNAMGTIIEGEWPEVLAVVQKCAERMQQDCDRIACTIKVDWRRNQTGRLDAKVASVERRLGRKLKT